MGGAIGASVGYALGIAISPIPIAALLLTLLSARPRANSISFTLGWASGIAGVATVAAVTPLFDDGDDPSSRRGWIRLTVGLILVLAAIRRWRTRPGPGEVPPTPPLMRAIDGVGRFGVLGIGFVLAAFNPKDMLLAAAGGVEIGSADLQGATMVVALAIFTAVAASTAVAPVGAYLVAGKRLDDRLRRSREWLIRHHPTVTAAVLVAVGAWFVIEAIGIVGG